MHGIFTYIYHGNHPNVGKWILWDIDQYSQIIGKVQAENISRYDSILPEKHRFGGMEYPHIAGSFWKDFPC